MTQGDIRVLIVDDQTLVRMGFRMLLDAEPGIHVVGEAADGAEGVRLAAREKPDVVLMDVRMPGLDGIAATAEVIRVSPDSRVIVLTTFDLDEYAFGGMRAGASGFLLKDTRPAELLAAVRAVAAGDAAVSPRVTRRMLELFGSRLPEPRATALDALTPREREILLAIAEGLTNRQIGEQMYLAEKTVKNYVSNLLLKLGMHRRTEAAVYAARLADRRAKGPEH